MDLDDPVCLCFRVTRRKLNNFARLHRPRVASQLSECGGAGTGCGWCIPLLQQLFRQSAGTDTPADMPPASECRRLRAEYVRAGHGVPPAGAAPADDPIA